MSRHARPSPATTRAGALRLIIHRLHDQLAALPDGGGPTHQQLMRRLNRARRHYKDATWGAM